MELSLEGSPRASPSFKRSYSSRLGLGQGKSQQQAAAQERRRGAAAELQQLVSSLQELRGRGLNPNPNPIPIPDLGEARASRHAPRSTAI